MRHKEIIKYFTDNFDINGEINEKYFNDAINIIYKVFGLNNNLFLCRLMKFYMNNPNHKIDSDSLVDHIVKLIQDKSDNN